MNDLICALLIILGLCGIVYGLSNVQCSAKASALGYAYDYKPFQGCVLVKPNGHKILLQQLRSCDDN